MLKLSLFQRLRVQRVTNFRLISLSNGIFKIITKVLANRLRPKMEKLVGVSQTPFIKGRSILDCIATHQEAITLLQEKEKGGWGDVEGGFGEGL